MRWNPWSELSCFRDNPTRSSAMVEISNASKVALGYNICRIFGEWN